MRQPKRRKINRKIVEENAGDEKNQPDIDTNIDNDMNWEFGEFSDSKSACRYVLTSFR